MTRTIQMAILAVIVASALALNGCGGKVKAEQPAQAVTQIVANPQGRQCGSLVRVSIEKWRHVQAACEN